MRARVAMFVFIVCSALQGCAGRSPLLRDEAPIALPFLLKYTDPATRSMKIALLRESNLPAGAKEVRIWSGFGTVHPDFMLRFQIGTDGALTGTLLAYAMTEQDPDDKKYNQWLRSVFEAMCSTIQRDEGMDSCAADASLEIHWKTIYQKLVALGVWTLPDESELPKPLYDMSDGSSFVVELRDGKGYRAYEYSNPGMREGLTAERATQLHRTTGDVIAPVFARALPKE